MSRTVSGLTSLAVLRTLGSWTGKLAVAAPHTWRKRYQGFRKNLSPLSSPRFATRLLDWVVCMPLNLPSALRNWRRYCPCGNSVCVRAELEGPDGADSTPSPNSAQANCSRLWPCVARYRRRALNLRTACQPGGKGPRASAPPCRHLSGVPCGLVAVWNRRLPSGEMLIRSTWPASRLALVSSSRRDGLTFKC